MSDNRTFAEKAKDLVETVKDKIMGHSDSKECQENECNQKVEELYNRRQGHVCNDRVCRDPDCNRRAEELCGNRVGRVSEESGYVSDQLRGAGGGDYSQQAVFSGLEGEARNAELPLESPPPYGEGQLYDYGRKKPDPFM